MDLEEARRAAGQGVTSAGPKRTRRGFGLAVFRLRVPLQLMIYLGGFGTTLAGARGAGRQQRVWLLLPEWLSRVTGVGLQSAILGVTAAAIGLALSTAMLRTWGAAYLGTKAVWGPGLDAREIVQAGPYRVLRNPVYAGTLMHTLALCLLMSWVGAVVTLGATLLLLMGLIGTEERALLKEHPSAYGSYVREVGRFLPRLTKGGHADVRARWGQAIAGETYAWGAAVSFAAFGTTYNVMPILQGLLISMGLGIVIHGLMRTRE